MYWVEISIPIKFMPLVSETITIAPINEIFLHLDPEIGRISETFELSIYRIVQESLNNIHKHSSATIAWINLERTSPRALMITIEDNGEGVVENFDLTTFSKGGHCGLIGIEERV